jgi:hypothetical protein
LAVPVQPCEELEGIAIPDARRRSARASATPSSPRASRRWLVVISIVAVFGSGVRWACRHACPVRLSI